MKKLMSSDEYKEKISMKNRGRKHTSEELRKMSIGNMGEKNGMYGRHGKNNPNSKPVGYLMSSLIFDIFSLEVILLVEGFSTSRLIASFLRLF
ncbi:MAG: hypothetical protein K5648_05810 [Erysipelotrichaceae bacterium]|nr:hypothetical protein [Erysipelotrichaceae bacterium]